MKNIKNSVAFVTGGASGLGAGTVRRLISHGASVVICDLPTSGGQKLADELGDRCVFASGDVTQERSVKEALKVVETKFKKLDILVNCAGIAPAGSTQPIYDFENDEPHSLPNFEKILSVNTTGTFNVIRLAVGMMGQNQPDDDGQRGVIVNVSSIAATGGPPRFTAYAASKAAIEGMTLVLARDLGSKGIRCCTIAPGYFDTPMFRQLAPPVIAKLEGETPFPPRFGRPDEFAHLVQAIVENTMLNGCVIRLDGGLRLKSEVTK